MVTDMRLFFYQASCELNNISNFCPLATFIARNDRELFSSNRGVSHLNEACRIDELSRGSVLGYEILTNN